MKKLTWTWQKIVSLIAALLGIGTLVSCYGTPIGLEIQYNPFLKGAVFGDLDNNPETEDERIPGIKVSALGITQITDELGKFNLNLEDVIEDGIENVSNDFEVTFEDIDGENNGSFKKESLHLSKYDSPFLGHVVLEKNKKD